MRDSIDKLTNIQQNLDKVLGGIELELTCMSPP